MPDTSTRQPVKNLLRMRIPCTGEPVFKARKRMGDLARRLGFHGETVDGILLAFSEAVTNALVYGNATVRKCVRVRAWVENSRLMVEVTDHGKGFSPGPVHLPPAGCMCEGGRGLYLMRALMDDVQWLATPHGTTVRMAICCVSPQHAPEAGLPVSALPVPVPR